LLFALAGPQSSGQSRAPSDQLTRSVFRSSRPWPIQCAAKAVGVYVVLGEELRAKVDNWDIVRISIAQNWVAVNIDFTEVCAELGKQGSDHGFGLVAQMAAGTRIQRDRASRSDGQTSILCAAVEIGPVIAQKTGLHQFSNGIENRRALFRRIPADELEQRVQVQRNAFELIERRQNPPSDFIHGSRGTDRPPNAPV
jgi:hypothetical protein